MTSLFVIIYLDDFYMNEANDIPSDQKVAIMPFSAHTLQLYFVDSKIS